MRPDFSKIAYQPKTAAAPAAAQKPWQTGEGIAVKSWYGAADLAGMQHLEYAAGVPPFLRGPYSTMYAMQPWTIRQYAGFSTAEESNAFYRQNLAPSVTRFGRTEIIRGTSLAVKPGERVAIIGSGPCGLTAAMDLVKQGYAVAVFEALPVAGELAKEAGTTSSQCPSAPLRSEYLTPRLLRIPPAPGDRSCGGAASLPG